MVQVNDLDDDSIHGRRPSQGLDRNADSNYDARVPHTEPQTESSHELGIDEAITITKQRAPIPKLDQERLLSQAGIPKLGRIAKSSFRYRKGHEFTDTARLLHMYQLWLDDLYPRAKFADGLAMVEKLGHTKKMQTMRRHWISEASRHGCRDDSVHQAVADGHDDLLRDKLRQVGSGSSDLHQTGEGILQEDSGHRSKSHDTSNHYLIQQTIVSRPNHHLSTHERVERSEPQDDLDILLAEQDGDQVHLHRMEDNRFKDEMEFLDQMEF